MSEIPRAILGRTGASVTKLGYGAMELRRRTVTPEQAERVLNSVLDAGINMIDTSPDYGPSEGYIGDYLARRRTEFFLASKCGCPVNVPAGGRPPHVYTRSNVRAGVEQSLKRMKTDYLDLVQFHMSPTRAELEQNDSLAELDDLKSKGKIRFIGMSGILPELTEHIAMDVFDVFQIPYSALEREHEALICAAKRAGAGTIIRGGVARGIPTVEPGAVDRYPEALREEYAQRRGLWEAADLDSTLNGMCRMEFMVRFTLSHPAMSTMIVGTTNLAHLAENIAAANKGPLLADQYADAKVRLDSAAGVLAGC